MTGFQSYKNHILIHAVVLVWGFTGILGTIITIDSESMVFYRMGIAFLSLLIFMAFGRRHLIRFEKRSLIYIGVGFIVAAHWALFFEALKVSTVSVTLACLASTSLFVAIIEPLFFRRRVDALEIIFGLLVVAGLYTIFEFETQYKLGILYALFAAFAAATFGTLNGLLIKRGSSYSITLYEMLGGVIGIALYQLLSGNFDLAIPNSMDWLYLAILGILCTAVAFVISVEVMKHLTPFTVSISINMEPIYAILLALLFFGEREYMSTGFYLGAGIILTTVIANGMLKSPRGKKWLKGVSRRN